MNICKSCAIFSESDGCTYGHPFTSENCVYFVKKKALEKQIGGGHYKNLAIQPIEYCQKNKLTYCESNVIKYVTRHKFKNGKEDIKKAIHNLELLLEMEYANE